MERSSQFGRVTLSIRAERLGVRVKLTMSDTTMAKAMV